SFGARDSGLFIVQLLHPLERLPVAAARGAQCRPADPTTQSGHFPTGRDRLRVREAGGGSGDRHPSGGSCLPPRTTAIRPRDRRRGGSRMRQPNKEDNMRARKLAVTLTVALAAVACSPDAGDTSTTTTIVDTTTTQAPTTTTTIPVE